MSDLRLLEIDLEDSPGDGQVATFDAVLNLWKPANPRPASADFIYGTWTPVVSVPGGSTLTIVGSPTINIAEVLLVGEWVTFNFRATVELGGTADTQLEFTLPVEAVTVSSACFAAEILDGGTIPKSARSNISSVTTGIISKYDTATIATGAGKVIAASGSYKRAVLNNSGELIGIAGITYP